MRLVVLDTNVIVSAAINPSGAPSLIVQAAMRQASIQLAVSPAVVTEYRQVFRYAKFKSYDFPPLWLEFLIETAMRFSGEAPWPHPLPDEHDAPFLSLAQQAHAWLITGNLRHYPAAARAGVIVHTPADYITLLEQTR